MVAAVSRFGHGEKGSEERDPTLWSAPSSKESRVDLFTCGNDNYRQTFFRPRLK